MNNDELKRQAAEVAAETVESGMVVGLGTGSTAVYAVHVIGQKLQDGRLRDIVAIPTSDATARVAEAWGIPLTSLNDFPVVDVTIDGADEIDPSLNLIKGRGGALLREKIVATASHRVVIVTDQSKRVGQLGQRAPLPVEVVPFARRPVAAYLESLGAEVALRLLEPAEGEAERPFITDEGNLILDCQFGPIANPVQLAQTIRARPGVVEHGLFLGIATQAVIATPGGVEVLHRA